MTTRARPHGKQKIRISGGTYRGQFITFGDFPDLRPTLGRVREAVFSMLRPYAETHGFIDLFAGSGIMGFEAASRGFHPVLAIEKHPAAAADLQLNVRQLDAPITVHKTSAFTLDRLALPPRPWILYADPPYRNKTGHDDMLQRISTWSQLMAGSLYVAEFETATPPPILADYTTLKHKKYGRTAIAVLQIPEPV